MRKKIAEVVIEPTVVEEKKEVTTKPKEEETEIEPAFEPEIDDSPAPKVKISGVTLQGEIAMTFDQDMFAPSNANSIDFSSILSVAI